MKNKILELINNIDIITKEFYEELIYKYDKKLVDFVIDSQIDEVDIEKYEYYINQKYNEYENKFNGSCNIYINDVKRCKRFNNLDNNEHVNMIFSVVDELNNIFTLYGYNIVMSELSVLERVNLFLEKCMDKDSLSMVRELSLKYIDLRNKLVVGNLNLVLAMARPYFINDNDRLEIIQNGNVGLMMAIDKYKTNMNTKFSTYACFWIKRNIIIGLKRMNSSFSVPFYLSDYNSVRVRVINELTEKLDRIPSDLEVVNKMGISLEKFEQIKFAFDGVMSLSDLENIEDNGEDIEYLIDNNVNILESYIENEKKTEILKVIKESLTNNEYLILTKRYGLDESEVLSQREIGEQLGMARACVAFVQKRALQKIRKKCNDFSIYW